MAGLPCDDRDGLAAEFFLNLLGIEANESRPDTICGQPARSDVAANGAGGYAVCVGDFLDRQFLRCHRGSFNVGCGHEKTPAPFRAVRGCGVWLGLVVGHHVSGIAGLRGGVR